MRATLLPENQLRYVLLKQGFVEDKSGDFINSDCGVVSSTFNFCLKEIEIYMAPDPFFNYAHRDEKDTLILFNNEWFIPNSFKDN